MKQIVVLSGTGKTSVVASFAGLAEKPVLSDCDVDAVHVVDGAPGIGCPVIASVAAADLVLVVTEPTVSGEHDLNRVVDLTRHFGMPTVVCINKYDINENVTARIKETAASRDIPVVGTIRYDKAVSKAQTVGATLLKYTSGPVSRDIEAVWRHVVYALG